MIDLRRAGTGCLWSDLNGMHHLILSTWALAGSRTGVLKFESDVEQATPHERFRLCRESVDGFGDWRLQAHVAKEWRNLYRFDVQIQQPIDDEMPNHFQATHPDSRFVRDLVVARALPQRRLGLLNRDLHIHQSGAESQHRVLHSPAELLSVLDSDFGLAVPNHPMLEVRLANLFIGSSVNIDGCP